MKNEIQIESLEQAAMEALQVAQETIEFYAEQGLDVNMLNDIAILVAQNASEHIMAGKTDD